MLLKKSKLLCTPSSSVDRNSFKARLEEGMITKKPVTVPNMGLMKGIVKTATKMPGGKGVIIITEEDSYLELKLTPESVANWLQILRLLA
mmetsp:Transcript_3317/g.4581  ORF Transcript_3317/g.4581 Transcript_3317/m.4581 type:complete len:90 (-) Transcript_3317:70-339(-)